jgi:antibiotic biosynthesis monooxygenase (ABM) superfamily enzyme
VSTEATHVEPGPAAHAPATVVVSQWVRPGREGDFRQWQDGMNRAVASFAGFVGTEVVAPEDGGTEWTVIYRFDTRPHLETWLASAERDEVLGRGADLFERPASQQVLMGAPEEQLVTVVVSHSVDPALQDEFVAWQQRATDAERGFPGFRGSELFRPVPGVQEEWTAMFRFDTQEHVDGWLESPERKKLLDEGRQFQDFELHRVSSPFGSWFTFGGNDTEAPAPWKTTLSVLVGLYPTVVLLTLAIAEVWPTGEMWASLLLGNVLSVCLLTWVVMPVVTRALRFWLAPAKGHASRRVEALGVGASVVFLACAALVFWLVTTRIWTLP